MKSRDCIDVNRRGDKNCVPAQKKDFIFVTLLVSGIICVTSFLWIYFIIITLSIDDPGDALAFFYLYVVPWLVVVGIMLVSFSFLVKFGFFDKKKKK